MIVHSNSSYSKKGEHNSEYTGQPAKTYNMSTIWYRVHRRLTMLNVKMNS